MSVFLAIFLILAACACAAFTVFIGYLWYWLHDSYIFESASAYLDECESEMIRKSIDGRVMEFVKAAEAMVESGRLTAGTREAYIDRCLLEVGLKNDALVEAKIMSAYYDIAHRD